MSCTGKSREKWLAGAAVLICGLVTHGYILTNKISYHDDSVNYFGVGTTFESGRWALGLIQKFLTKIDFFNYSSSWWNGLLSILLVAVCAMILSELFQIKHTGYAVLVGVLLISFPAMTSLFAYIIIFVLLPNILFDKRHFLTTNTTPTCRKLKHNHFTP